MVPQFYSAYLINFPRGHIIRAIKIIIRCPPLEPPYNLLTDFVRSSPLAQLRTHSWFTHIELYL